MKRIIINGILILISILIICIFVCCNDKPDEFREYKVQLTTTISIDGHDVHQVTVYHEIDSLNDKTKTKRITYYGKDYNQALAAWYAYSE